MSKGLFSVLTGDYGNAVDLGYRLPSGSYAVVRIYDDDGTDEIERKLKQFAEDVERINLREPRR